MASVLDLEWAASCVSSSPAGPLQTSYKEWVHWNETYTNFLTSQAEQQVGPVWQKKKLNLQKCVGPESISWQKCGAWYNEMSDEEKELVANPME